MIQQKRQDLENKQLQVEQILKTRGRGTEMKELKRKEIQLEIQF